MWRRFLPCGLVLGFCASNALAAELIYFSTDALAPAMRQLVPEFEKASGHVVRMTVANAGTIAARIESGEPADLAIVLPPAWQRLRDAKKIDPDVRFIVGKVGLGAFVRKGAPKPDISSEEAFRQTLLRVRSVAVRDPAQRSPVGTYMLTLFERLNLAEAVKPKLLLTSHPPYEEVSEGKADIGFSTLAEIASDGRADLAGPLPAGLQTYNVFTTAIPVTSRERDAVAAFLRYLSSEPSRIVLRAKGIDVD